MKITVGVAIRKNTILKVRTNYKSNNNIYPNEFSTRNTIARLVIPSNSHLRNISLSYFGQNVFRYNKLYVTQSYFIR